MSKVTPGLLRFCFTSLCELAPLSQPIRFKSETNRDLVTHVFPRFRQFACSILRVLIGSLRYFPCNDWLMWLLYFGFYDTQSKTALLASIIYCIFHLLWNPFTDFLNFKQDKIHRWIDRPNEMNNQHEEVVLQWFSVAHAKGNRSKSGRAKDGGCQGNSLCPIPAVFR